ncbi:MAG TPA: zinc dependent phospholipase C family protein [Halanaerobiales bacterium]|nr:zinc dependent phospholipase C family protein [Halanaerobiales bacterium]
MKKLEARTHTLLAKKIYNFFKKRNVNLSKFWLTIGSVKPDFTNDDINHYKDESIYLFYEKFSELKNIDPEKDIKNFSMKLGEIFHYTADFFCHAHNNKKMENNYLYHFKYEWQLNKFAYNSKSEIFNLKHLDPYIYQLTLKELMNYKHKEYSNKKTSFKNDLFYSFQFSIFITNKLLANAYNQKLSNPNFNLNIAK